jgi:hypothetical protein
MNIFAQMHYTKIHFHMVIRTYIMHAQTRMMSATTQNTSVTRNPPISDSGLSTGNERLNSLQWATVKFATASRGNKCTQRCGKANVFIARRARFYSPKMPRTADNEIMTAAEVIIMCACGSLKRGKFDVTY